ncbi:FadR/GntR family transcriptional regulator [Pollutimonas harenae]|uniref:FadR family transcriptional regulator n=1 Tax=Pollutimonas harenae TaxID=657015 RepID=A0A853GPV5_9BURK|nr:FadR/GntR family transcriptional regulator [Pollutimonas harenae]NYT84131.1 FadR family transcriptional regulator [Pollutimonas harenae]TEA73451.1 FadR family transcriptional regulator [Pollutimonas harenae]
MQTNQPANERTLSDRLTDMLAREIRSGAYPVNSRLPTEKFMTEEYGVSRTVVREVLSRLKSAGLVETRQGSGTVVLDPASSDAFRLGRPDDDPARGVLRIIELRRGLEGEMAALAAARRSKQDMLRINRALAAIDNAVELDGDGVEEDLAFHIAIAQATGNPHYPELLGMLTRALKDAIRVTRGNEARQAQLAEDVRKEHEAIRAAIEAQDSEAARVAAFRHMSSTAQRIQNVDTEYWKGASSAAAGRLARTRLAAELRKAK